MFTLLSSETDFSMPDPELFLEIRHLNLQTESLLNPLNKDYWPSSYRSEIDICYTTHATATVNLNNVNICTAHLLYCLKGGSLGVNIYSDDGSIRRTTL